jgi:hypothetical protein
MITRKFRWEQKTADGDRIRVTAKLVNGKVTDIEVISLVDYPNDTRSLSEPEMDDLYERAYAEAAKSGLENLIHTAYSWITRRINQ